jgi:hypothetical protein
VDAVRRTVSVAAVGLLVTMLIPVGTAHGSLAHDSVVQADPADFTPNVESGSSYATTTVLALAQGGDTIYAGGFFHTVTDADGSTTYQRDNLMAFSATTGQMRPFDPDVNGKVWAVEEHDGALFVGGEFTSVNGVPRPGLVKLDATTGRVITEFRPRFSEGDVTQVRMVGRRLVVGGTFPGKLRALDPRTGADTGFIRLAIRGSVADNAGLTNVYRFDVSPAGTRLLAIGNFTSVGGVPRRQAFMLDLRGHRARLDSWFYRGLNNKCRGPRTPAFLRDVDFSPDGKYFVVVGAGYVARTRGLGRDICDAAARFETHIAKPYRPTWINYTGGDTLHSVAVTGRAVYVQGHQRWLDNPLGRGEPGPGAVSRPGIGAIQPLGGKALAWNPGKTRGVGGKDFLVTDAGLWVGSDGTHFAGEYRARIAFLPL